MSSLGYHALCVPLTAMGFPPSPETISAERADPGPDIAGVVASGRPLRRSVYRHRPRGWCCADGRDGFRDRRHTQRIHGSWCASSQPQELPRNPGSSSEIVHCKLL